jgi:hypothetical protein
MSGKFVSLLMVDRQSDNLDEEWGLLVEVGYE